MIPYGRQWIDDDDVAAVVRVLKSDWITQGPLISEFEEAVRAITGSSHAVAFSSGTAALHAAAAAAELGPGDRVATSTLSFAASAACALYVGAEVVLVDIEPATLNMDLSQLPGRCDALVAVHFAGLPLDLSGLGRRPRVVIEDAAHALGATTPWGPVGNCARSDMCVFSFHPVKAVTTAEGGMVTTNSRQLASRLRRFRSHDALPKPECDPWLYEIESLGYNYRLTDIQAALGVSQLGKLERFVSRRQVLAARYREALADLPLELPPEAAAGFTHAYHLFALRVPHRRRVYDQLRLRGVAGQVHYLPIHRHRLYAPFARGQAFPAADRAYNGLLSIPLFPALTDHEQHEVVRALRAVIGSLDGPEVGVDSEGVAIGEPKR